jgi:hypothetical protein
MALPALPRAFVDQQADKGPLKHREGHPGPKAPWAQWAPLGACTYRLAVALLLGSVGCLAALACFALRLGLYL